MSADMWEDPPGERSGRGDRRSVIEEFTGLPVERLMRIGYKVARRHTRSLQDAEDILQDAFLHVIRAVEKGAARPEKGASYFARVVQNVALEMWRRRSARMRGGHLTAVEFDEGLAVKDGAPGPDRRAESAALRRAILSAVSKLSMVNREVVELALDIEAASFSRMSQDEIAARLGIGTGTVKSRLHEAKKKLAVALADWHEEDDR